MNISHYTCELPVTTMSFSGGMGGNQICNPSIPYVGPISGGVREGLAILFQAAVPMDANEFTVSLKTGPSEVDDIALKFVAQPGQGHGFFNSCQAGLYGFEERVNLPLIRGQPFNLIIVVNSADYKVLMNNQELCQFKHQIPVGNVNALSVVGDIAVQNIVFMDALQMGGGTNVMSFGEIGGFGTGGMVGMGGMSEIGVCGGMGGMGGMGEIAVCGGMGGMGGMGEIGVCGGMGGMSTTGGFGGMTTTVISGPFGECPIGGTASLGSSSLISQVTQTVSDLNLPYTGPITGGLRPGMALYFMGFIPMNGNIFSINLKTGDSLNDDNAFHFNPRLGDQVVLNSFQNGGWQTEQFAPVNHFKKGTPFELAIVIDALGYQVFVNGEEHCKFQHRIPLERVNTLYIDGDVSIMLWGFITSWQTTTWFTEFSKTTSQFSWIQSSVNTDIDGSITSPVIPYNAAMSRCLTPGIALYFQGMIPQDATRFSINLKTGDSLNDDNAFHFNPRLGDQVVLNSFQNGGWQTEQFAPINHFKKGTPFELAIVIDALGYQVFVNGEEHCKFQHRIPLERVNTLYIDGDVSIMLWGFITSWQTTTWFTEFSKTTSQFSWIQSSVNTDIDGSITSPVIPYNAAMNRCLTPGIALYFQGMIPQDATRFSINLKTGDSLNDDNAFHFNPRLGDQVVLNSFQNGGWQTEQFAPVNHFKKGTPFELAIVIDALGYQVFVNGEEHCKFQHRIPLERVNTLYIDGDVSIMLWGFITSWQTTTWFTEFSKTTSKFSWIQSSVNTDIDGSITSPVIPYNAAMNRCLTPGIALYFQGMIPQDATRFSINLKTGDSLNDDNAFHFNPRLGDQVVLNSFQNGGWQTEQFAPVNHFKKGTPFELAIVIDALGYQVFVNGEEHCKFQHRIPLERVNTLYIDGDVSIMLWGFITSWQTTTWFTEFSKTTSKFSWIQSSVNTDIDGSITSPVIPYNAAMNRSLTPGIALYFQGMIPQDATRFSINLKTGDSLNDDNAFHFNPRLGDQVVLNSFQNGGWQTEQFAPVNHFKKGTPFELAIVIDALGYQVFVNGEEHCKFQHRIPLERVNTLYIDGDVSIMLWGFITSWQTTTWFTEFSKTTSKFSWIQSSVNTDIDGSITSPVIPYNAAMNRSLTPGIALYFQGMIPQDATRFSINLKTGDSLNDDNAFHFNPRLGDQVVLNSFQNGGWQTEQFAPVNHFKKGTPFELAIVIDALGYQVFVNGEEHCKFQHRIPLERVNTLYIDGDVSIMLWGFITSWQTTTWFTEFSKTTSKFSWIQSSVNTDIDGSITSPVIPYNAAMNRSLTPGIALYFQGMIPQDATRFSINLKTGDSLNDDNAFHFNPRLGDQVVLNSFQNGGWQTEQFAPVNHFKKGTPFELAIVIDALGYQVFVNGEEHCKFQHRIPLERVNTLYIDGDVSIMLWGFITSWQTTTWFTEFSKTTSKFSWIQSSVNTDIDGSITSPVIPYNAAMNRSLTPGIALYFQGMIPQDATRFSINLKTGDSLNDDNAFHFNPRLGDQVVLNSFQNGGWQTEQFAPVNHFKKGTPFELAIVIDALGYQVFVNGEEHCKFQHRIPLERVNTLYIDGDVSIMLWGFITSWQTTTWFTEFSKTTSQFSWIQSSVNTDIDGSITSPVIPYNAAMNRSLTPGIALYFQGMIPQDATRFSINLKTGDSLNDDNAFHFNPRLGDKVVLNSFQNGGWQTEQFAPVNHFKKLTPFELAIVIDTLGYQVFVNGEEHCKFQHRIPLERVNTLYIDGDVSIMLWGFITSWQTTTWFTEFSKTTSQFSWIQSSVNTDIDGSITSPVIPYNAAMNRCLTPGIALYFQGMIPQDATRFSINLKTGDSLNDDNAFHFNPRLGDKVVLNSFQNGGWQTEQFAPINHFKKGTPFELAIVIDALGYQVFVNGEEHCKFQHRIPLERVNTLYIDGDVSIMLWGFITSWQTTTWFTEFSKTTSQFSWIQSSVNTDIDGSITSPVIPYNAAMNRCLTPGIALYFQGMIPQDATRFSINLKTGDSLNDDNAFHFNPRLGDKVVLNSFQNGGWQTEQFAPINHFKKGTPFELAIVIDALGYQVFVNGEEHCKFQHRIPLERVNTLYIDGDVSIMLWGFITNWQTTTWFIEFSKITSKFSWLQTTVNTEIEDSIANPSIPYTDGMENALTPGMALYIQGTIPTDATGFSINLKTGDDDNDDNAFHFNPRLGDKVVLNSFQDGGWQKEEFASIEHFKKGAPFEMAIVFHSENYQVFVNGELHSVFQHRIPLELVDVLHIAGGVSIMLMGFIQNWTTTSWFTNYYTGWIGSTVSAGISHEVKSPSIPYVCNMPGVMRAGVALCIEGTVPQNADGFGINIRTGESGSGDIAFHYNPRLGQKVALNSFRTGWEKEECASISPFSKGGSFEMAIVFRSDGYQVYVNGEEHCLFLHRIPLENVRSFEIVGSVSITALGFMLIWNPSAWLAEYIETWQKSAGFEIGYHVINQGMHPFDCKFVESLKTGMALYIKGRVPLDSKGFAINLRTGTAGTGDIAFHFNPRMGQRVALNTFRNRKWEKELSSSVSVFNVGDSFDLVIAVKAEGYQVFVDGEENCLFPHRIPVGDVKSIQVNGSVSIMLLGFIQNWTTTTWKTEKHTCIRPSRIQVEPRFGHGFGFGRVVVRGGGGRRITGRRCCRR